MQNQKEKKEEIGENCYLNKNCWLVKNLNYAPYKRCQYCEFKFRNCLFLQYQGISLFLIILYFSLFLLIEKRLSSLAIITVFTLVIIYGYFFNRSTEKIIRSNFSLRKTQDVLKELSENLEDKVNAQTKDITEKNNYLQELLNMKTEFLRVVNHQLNTPLSIMRNAFAMVDEKIFTPEKGFTFARSGLERISDTISDFWEAYELEGVKMQMNIGRTNIEGIVSAKLEEKKKLPIAIQRQLELKIIQPEFKVPEVDCDAQKIVHVISNLLDNAIYYTEKGLIAVSYQKLPKFLRINVEDTGMGISQDNKERLFKKFSRGQGAINLRPDGSGLGLFIAKKIVEGNNGKIGVESKGEGNGALFYFTLPISHKKA